MPHQIRYDEPFYWWGPRWESTPHPSLADLLRDGTVDETAAAILWAVLARRRSMAVIGGPSGLGKTTLLSALIGLLPPDVRRLYLRGCFETFAFLEDISVEPGRAALLINEISPHLPIYLWGPAVGRALDSAASGYALLATAHGNSVPQFVASLAVSPLRIPATKIAAFEYVALLEPDSDTASGRRLAGIWLLHGRRLGVDIQQVYPSSEDGPFLCVELEQRRRALAQFRAGEIEQLPWLIPEHEPFAQLTLARESDAIAGAP